MRPPGTSSALTATARSPADLYVCVCCCQNYVAGFMMLMRLLLLACCRLLLLGSSQQGPHMPLAHLQLSCPALPTTQAVQKCCHCLAVQSTPEFPDAAEQPDSKGVVDACSINPCATAASNSRTTGMCQVCEELAQRAYGNNLTGRYAWSVG